MYTETSRNISNDLDIWPVRSFSVELLAGGDVVLHGFVGVEAGHVLDLPVVAVDFVCDRGPGILVLVLVLPKTWDEINST